MRLLGICIPVSTCAVELDGRNMKIWRTNSQGKGTDCGITFDEFYSACIVSTLKTERGGEQ